MTDQTPPLPTLPMQLMLNLGCWLSSPFAWGYAKNAWPASNSSSSNQAANTALREAINLEAKNRAASLLKGILRYYEIPHTRDVEEPPCIWRKGNARLLDYGTFAAPHSELVTVLLVPSLINRYYILDLNEERSLLRYMAAQGVYPLVLDWGAPGTFEQSFGCSDYINEILLPAIDFITRTSQQRIKLVGYCMGGNLSLAATQLRREQVSALALLSTPWDFHCKEFVPFVVDSQWLPMIEQFIATKETLPAEIIQSLFYLTDPFVFGHKFRRFAGLDPESREAKEFVALERWVNDGVPITANVARDCLLGWAQRNELAKGQWQIAGKTINPAKLKLPAFIAMPENDHVVPRGCALPLAEAMPHAQVVYPTAGHVSMIVGSQAKKELWQPLTQWVKEI
jgi:poly(3-hydroxyalkanoate) synthetase